MNNTLKIILIVALVWLVLTQLKTLAIVYILLA